MNWQTIASMQGKSILETRREQVFPILEAAEIERHPVRRNERARSTPANFIRGAAPAFTARRGTQTRSAFPLRRGQSDRGRMLSRLQIRDQRGSAGGSRNRRRTLDRLLAR